MFSSLFARLSLVFFAVLVILGLSTIWLSHQINQQYFLESHQRLNSPIAMYMAQNAGLAEDGAPDPANLEKLSQHLAMLNPSIDAYLLDTEGNIIAPAGAELQSQKISLQPIHDFLHGTPVLPLFGDNPKDNTTQNIFSAAPLSNNSIASTEETHVGYVYVVLAGERHKSLLTSISNSYSTKILVALLLGALALAMLCGLILFFKLTRRLRKLTSEARDWLEQNELEADIGPNQLPTDEIDALSMTYDSMAGQLVMQYRQLEHNDRNRRDFFANISHDLRTPLTTLQSYLETLVLKQESMDDESRNRYIRTAHRQSKRLRRLIMQLFELSKLTAGEISIKREPFSLLEFAYDCGQDFSIHAKQKGVTLRVYPATDNNANLDVNADIALIQRVFENLISNAIQHTPRGGKIGIWLHRVDDDKIMITIKDTGNGISQKQIKHVFERHYSDVESAGDNNGNAGLGLTIVKNILELHNSEISISSKRGQGTTFKFSLPASM